MRFFSVVAAALGLVGAVNAVPVSNSELFESLRTVPQGWRETGSPKPNKRVFFRIAVHQPNQGLFEQTLYDISTPSHPNYGKHLKRDELKAMLKPAEEATEAIIDWLQDSGIRTSDIEDDGEWINFVATVSQAEKMMDTTFKSYRSRARKVSKIRTLSYSLPKDLHQYIDMIQPTTRFGQLRPEFIQVLTKQDIGTAGSVGGALNVTACNSTITPTCLKDLYNINGYTPKEEGTGFVGVNGFLEEYARYADLTDFAAEYAPWVKNASFEWSSVNGGVLDQNSTADSVEANLDIQYTVAISDPIKNRFYSTPGRGPLVPDLDQPSLDDNENEPYLEFFTYLTNLPDDQLPHTLSTSYGEDEQSVPASYAQTVCNMIGQLGSRGTTVIFSSGDTGVGSACQTNDGKNTTRFLPIFPAACPYVTSVGGTHYVEPESAISFSSGGFSDLWPRPSYQDEVVPAYLEILGDRWDGLYNKEGRGFPDISAQSSRFHIIDSGREVLVGGTSASAPTIAGIIGLLNGARLEQGLPTLGFLNPWLYSEAKGALTDITNGGSTGCTGFDIYSGLETPYVPYASWNATEGWDPVTGNGTPDFQKLLAIATANATKGYTS